ncbi:glycosyltransferase family 2 protein [soil metagenome]
MSFSIIVVNWESEAPLANLIGSMNRHLSGDEELVVVDNASKAGAEAETRGWKGAGLYLAADRNHGFGAAANAGVAEASHEAVVILNPDTELLDGGLAELAELALRERCLAGPRVLERDGRIQPSASGPPVGAWPWVRALVPSPLGPDRLLARTAPWRLRETTEVTWLSGACVAGPTAELRALGPFDPAIHLYGEDMDLGLRAAVAGMRSLFAPGLSSLIHDGKSSTSQRFENLGLGEVGRNGRAVLARQFGTGPERRAYRAELAAVKLRVAAKSALGRDHEWDSRVLAGLREAAGTVAALGDPPPEPLVVTERLKLGGGHPPE